MNFVDQLSKLPADSRRKAAADYLVSKGFPTKQDEDWKYTSLKKVFEKEYVSTLLTEEDISHDLLKQVASDLDENMINLVFINGRFNKTLSSDYSSVSGLQIELTPRETSSGNYRNGVAALGQMFHGQGLKLVIDSETQVEQPIRLYWFTDSIKCSMLVCPQVHISVGARSKATILETFSGAENSLSYVVNSLTEVVVDESATLNLVRLENDTRNSSNFGYTCTDQGKHSSIHMLSMTIGAGLSRHDVYSPLKNENSTLSCFGVYYGSGSQHMDHCTLISHEVGNCQSTQLYKGILADKAHGVFTGKVFIAKDAQKANSDQLNNTLLLSSEAEIDSKPVLMIYADDVKATHGSTIGQLNQEELFYLQSRGISADQSKSLLMRGYVKEPLLKIEDASIQNYLEKKLIGVFK